MSYTITVFETSKGLGSPKNFAAPLNANSGKFFYKPQKTHELALDTTDSILASGAQGDLNQTLQDPLTTIAGTIAAGTVVTVSNAIIVRNADNLSDRYILATLNGADGLPLHYGYLSILIPLDGAPIPPEGMWLQFVSAQPPEFSFTMESTGNTCFTPGTLIATPGGDRAVETLRPGDLVLTRDHGPQAIRWIGRRELSARQLDVQPNQRPVQIAAGALGPGLPACGLTISPQHRILIVSKIAQRMFGSGEVLCAARHMAGTRGVAVRNPPAGVTYMHLLLDRHELICSGGVWTETLYPGPEALRSLPVTAREEIHTLFPALHLDGPPPGARPFLTGRETRSLMERHQNKQRDLVC